MTEIEKAKRILELTAEHFGLTPHAMCGRGRMERIAWPRQVAMALMREFTDLSLQQIAEITGRSDHGTVCHAIEAVECRVSVHTQSMVAVHHLRGLARSLPFRPVALCVR